MAIGLDHGRVSFFDASVELLAPAPDLNEIYQQIMEAMKQALAQGIHQVFVLCLIIMAAGLISVFFLKELKLRDKKSSSATGEKTVEETAEVVGMF